MKLKYFLFIALFLSFTNCFSQDFEVLATHYKGQGLDTDYPFKGTFIVKDNSLILDCKQFFLDAKTNTDSNGIITYQYENREYKLQIIDKKGTYSKISYDYILITKTDDIVGGEVSTYYCKIK